MSNLLRSLLRGAGGEASALSALGRWRQAVSQEVDNLGASVSSVIWRPGTPSTDETFETWAEVYTAIQATESRVIVYVDNSLDTPDIPVGVYELENRVEFQALAPKFGLLGPPTFVNMVDGAVLRNLLQIQEQLRLTTNQTAAPALEFDDASVFSIGQGGVLENGGTGPIVEVLAGNTFGLGLKNTGTLSGNTPLFNLNDTAQMALNATDGSFIQNDIISGDAASQLIYIADNTFTPPTLSPGFAGTYAGDFRVSNAARDVPASGDTASRPSGGIPFGPLVGQMYFDTTLGQPIWWDGAAWVDATGAPA